MARRKTKKASTPKRFLALETNCGSSTQLAALCGGNQACAYATVDDARAAVKDAIEYNGLDGTTYVIAEIIDVGAPNEVTWGGTSLKD